MAAPETYWEKRCSIAEQTLHRLMLIVGGALYHTQDHIVELGEKWDEAIEKLDIEEADFITPAEKGELLEVNYG